MSDNTITDDATKSRLILAEVDALFHSAEKSSPDGSVTYLDVILISDRVRSHFKDTPVPKRIEGTLDVACGLCNPNKIAGINSIKNGLGAIIAGAGGIALMWGIVTVIGLGVVQAGSFGALWWHTTWVTILWGGPIGIAIGIASIAAGVYFLSNKLSPKERAIMALDTIRKGVADWGQAGDLPQLPEVKWVLSLSPEEYKALLSVLWHMAHIDNEISQEEVRLLEHVFKARKPEDTSLAIGEGTMDYECAITVLRQSQFKADCGRLVKSLINIDRSISKEEEQAWAEIAAKMDIPTAL